MRLNEQQKQKLFGMIKEALDDLDMESTVRIAPPSARHQFDDRYITASTSTVELDVDMTVYISPDGLEQLGLIEESDFHVTVSSSE